MMKPGSCARALALAACVAITAYFCLGTSCLDVTTTESATVAVPFEAGQRSAVLRVAAEGATVALRMDRQLAITLGGRAVGPEPDAGALVGPGTNAPYCGAPTADHPATDETDVVICENLEAAAQPVDYELVRDNADVADAVTVTGTVSMHTCERFEGALGIRLEAMGSP